MPETECITIDEINDRYKDAKVKLDSIRDHKSTDYRRAKQEVELWNRRKYLFITRARLNAHRIAANVEPGDFKAIAARLWKLVGDLISRHGLSHDPKITEDEDRLLDLTKASFQDHVHADLLALKNSSPESIRAEIDQGISFLVDLHRLGALHRKLSSGPVPELYKKLEPVEKCCLPEDAPQLWSDMGKRGDLCAYCQEAPGHTWDHIVPRSRGGANMAINMVPACQPCNTAKADRMLNGITVVNHQVASWPSKIDWPTVREHLWSIRDEAQKARQQRARELAGLPPKTDGSTS